MGLVEKPTGVILFDHVLTADEYAASVKQEMEKAMTTQELAQQILDIAQRALEQDKRVAIYIGDDAGECAARDGLEAIIKLCKDVPHAQEAYKQYEKKVSHEKK